MKIRSSLAENEIEFSRMEKHFPGKNDAKEGGEGCQSYNRYINIHFLHISTCQRTSNRYTREGGAIFYFFNFTFHTLRNVRNVRAGCNSPFTVTAFDILRVLYK